VSLVELLLEHIDSEDTEAYPLASQLYDTVNRTYTLTNNLLNWTQAQTNKLEITFERHSVHELVDTNVRLIQNLADGKNIELIQILNERLYVEVDKNTIDTVLRNLLTNAIKFTHKGGKVEIEATRYEQEAMAEIRVKDNGTGIPADQISHLFSMERGFRTKGTENEQGSGPGLLICKEFVEKNGGTILVESTLDVGSTFTIRLPLADPSGEPQTKA
jgi:two-component system sensor histidine kinase/response regulator